MVTQITRLSRVNELTQTEHDALILFMLTGAIRKLTIHNHAFYNEKKNISCYYNAMEFVCLGHL